MPQVSAIVLTDGTTPKTYTPDSVDANRVFSFKDRSLGLKALDGTLTIQSRTAGNNSQLITMKGYFPHVITDADTGVSSVIENSHFELKIRHADQATDAERLSLVEYLESAIASTQTDLRKVLEGDENLY